MKIQCKISGKRTGTKPGCGYIWNCKSTHVYVSCPNCMKKILVVPLPLTEKEQMFILAYKKDKRVYDQGVADFGKEEVDRMINEANLEIEDIDGGGK